MATQIFVNLPVSDPPASMAFFTHPVSLSTRNLPMTPPRAWWSATRFT